MKNTVRFNTFEEGEERNETNSISGNPNRRNHGRYNSHIRGQIFVLLGFDEFRKQELENEILHHGGRVSPMFSRQTNFLVTTSTYYNRNFSEIDEMVKINNIPVISDEWIYTAIASNDVYEDIRRRPLQNQNNGKQNKNDFDWDQDSNDSDDLDINRPIMNDFPNIGENENPEEIDSTTNPTPVLSHDMQSERMEWQSFLSSVLTGEVIKSEKRRLSGSNSKAANISSQIWLGIRAITRGHTPAEEKLIIEETRQSIDSVLKEVIEFEVKPGDIPALDQVAGILQRIDACENLYYSRKAMMADKPLYKSQEFQYSLDALNSWLTVTRSLQTQLKILQNWTGSDTLEITRPKEVPADAENPSFLERILKENSLKQTFEKRTLATLNSLLLKAKCVMIENAVAFSKMKLPPYINELRQLLNFPTKLMEECMKLLLTYSSRLSEPTILMVQQMMENLRISLSLACQIKHQYHELIKPAKGWDIPPCIDENYNTVLLDSLKCYFKLLQWKLKIGYKAVSFKEAEILENEWSFLSGICRHIVGGDSETAIQFCSLTNKLLLSVMNYYDKELELPENYDPANITKWYNKLLETVRLRTRKLIRFTRFKNAAEYFIDDNNYQAFIDGLERTGHVLVYPSTFEVDGVCFIVEPSLQDRPQQIHKLLTSVLTSYEKGQDNFDDELKGLEYVLILSPRVEFVWKGHNQAVDMEQLSIDLKTPRTRLVADGAYPRLQACKQHFRKAVEGCGIEVLFETRANVPCINREMAKIKKTVFKFANKIIDSVSLIKEKTKDNECQDLIENCFSFATEIGQRCLRYMHRDALRAQLNVKLTRMAIDWVSFICDHCIATDRKTFRWAVIALEFAMATNRGNNILGLTESEFSMLRSKVGNCMRLLISHVDIMGAKSSSEALERERQDISDHLVPSPLRHINNIYSGEDPLIMRDEWMASLNELEAKRFAKEQDQRLVGKVLDDNQPENRPLVFLASSSSNISLRWQQGKFIGGGTFGSVYLAVNLDTGDLMAVKEIRFQDPSSLTTLYKSVKDEMSVMEMLDHPNIVSYYGIEVHRDKVYIFMEYCQGGSLASQLEHGRIEDERVIQYYVYQMLEGLVYLHENNIVHRDIKPDNHLGVIKFVDFGAAKILAKNQKTMGRTTLAPPNSSKSNVHSLTGTPMYMAPEVITGGEKGRKGSMDIWSLGCCVLEMATGKRPWSNLDNEWAVMFHVVTGHPSLPDSSQLSEQGIHFLEQCFIRSPQQRPSAQELLSHPWIDAGKEPTSTTPSGDWPINGSMVSTSGTSGTSISNSASATALNNSTHTNPFSIITTQTVGSTTQNLDQVRNEESRHLSPSLSVDNHQQIFLIKGLPSSTSVISVESEGEVGISRTHNFVEIENNNPVASVMSNGGDDWSLIGGSF
ncbi:1680_t:CDS:2 [Funneliformis caledonium]|uniref:1680_t:CDS:1 n=1 Tax=Funneliformis caledonium TaxID=1117310 RepID=A0A9N9F8C3_9GLOM|nr:1680_t:CDS:2 [Funneliformis caledonium]